MLLLAQADFDKTLTGLVIKAATAAAAVCVGRSCHAACRSLTVQATLMISGAKIPDKL